MTMRPKTTSRDLPPRMLRRERRLKSGKPWVGFYYDGRDEKGRRREIPLGTDLNEAKRRWAALDCFAPPSETGLMRDIFDRYERDVIPEKARSTQFVYLRYLRKLSAVFCDVHVDNIEPKHIAMYRDKRGPDARVVLNHAREWGYTSHTNPCAGVRKNKEKARDYYVEEDVWQAVYSASDFQELRDAMDLSYLTGQRPADVLKMRWSDIRDGALEVAQNKTGKKLRIMIEGELATLLERLRLRPVVGVTIISTSQGMRLSMLMRRNRFLAARESARRVALTAGNVDLAERIAAFQYPDIRPRAASDTTLVHATALLGHTKAETTRRIYRRKGERVSPLK